MELLITIVLIFLFVGFLVRHLGKYILMFLMRRMAKRAGLDPKNFSQGPQNPPEEAVSEPEQIIPDSVGEYVDFEEVK